MVKQLNREKICDAHGKFELNPSRRQISAMAQLILFSKRNKETKN